MNLRYTDSVKQKYNDLLTQRQIQHTKLLEFCPQTSAKSLNFASKKNICLFISFHQGTNIIEFKN